MTDHGNVRLTGTTKLDRVGLRARAHPDTVFNNLGHVITDEFLREAYRQLDKKKAVGIDKVTKEDYGKNLDENISQLIRKIRRNQYRPQASRIVEIPKEDGSTRPLAISCFEDKVVQLAVSRILEQIFEPVFLPSSYGFRPSRSCHDALKDLTRYTYTIHDGSCLEIDVRKYFNTIPHDALMGFLEAKITDKRFLKLIRVLITAPIMENGKAVKSLKGCPQGSIISPVLANIYLHYVVDEWFDTVRKTHMRGRAEQVRYADDMVFIFSNEADAGKFYTALKKRLNKFGLDVHEDKSSLIPSGKVAAMRAAQKGERMPTYKFLGFTCFWGKARQGFWRLKYTSRADRFTAKLKALREFLRKNCNTQDTDKLLGQVIRVVKGWVNYHAISDNGRRVSQFLNAVRRALLKWFNRRGKSRTKNWNSLMVRLDRVGFPKTFKTTSMFAKASNRGQ